jgi:hypothetical protein
MRCREDLNTDDFVFRDIAAKRRTTAYQHLKSLLVEPVGELAGFGGFE